MYFIEKSVPSFARDAAATRSFEWNRTSTCSSRQFTSSIPISLSPAWATRISDIPTTDQPGNTRHSQENEFICLLKLLLISGRTLVNESRTSAKFFIRYMYESLANYVVFLLVDWNPYFISQRFQSTNKKCYWWFRVNDSVTFRQNDLILFFFFFLIAKWLI